MSTVENDQVDLESLREVIVEADRRLSILRRQRDVQIKRAVVQGISIREAARRAGVSPSYAHRCAHHGRFASVMR
jgi:hypothetical protein